MAQERYRTGRTRTAPKPQPNPSVEQRKKASLRKKKEAEERAERRRIAARRRRYKRGLFRISLALSLVFVMLYYAYVAIAISTRSDGSADAMDTLVFQEGKRKEEKTISADITYRKGAYYLPVTELEEMMAISQFGDHRTRSFMLCDSEEYASFVLNSCDVIVNGEKVSTKNPAFVENDVLYLPMDFVTEKMNCFTFSEAVPAYGANVLTFLKTADPAFRFHPTPPESSVSVDTIPVLAPAETPTV